MDIKLFTSRILFYSLRNLGHMEELVHVKQEKEQSEIADPRRDLLCVANKWKVALNERSLVANV